MKQFKIVVKKLILIVLLISILIMFFATPVSNAKLDLEDGDFYYSGTTEGSYKPKNGNIFSWFIESLADIADWILGIITLGPRMVFVGWTALLEKLLTWGVESASGVSVDGTIVSDPTDLTDVTDSKNNITVEAIVYNKVAALDADIFETEFDRTLSATGHRLVCENCEEFTDDLGLKRYKAKYADECISAEKAAQIMANPESYGDVESICTCACGGCDACRIYVEQLKIKDPIIFRLKQLIATWYYIIRTLAMAAMLVVLLAIGIKMAISTIASDKAVYKRMLVDWVVGVIMLFTLHYFMVFVISTNDIMIGVIEKSAQSVNQASLESVADDLNMELGDLELASKDLEIRVYEEIRTRAYDAKLTNGMTGMIMYMALVFMAIKFTVIYVKRLFTIMILTLMAPGIGVAYALQKVFSGKSHALKTWMTEYIMNVIIQIVHALIYAIFISQALILSLTNIAGMIFALVLMNYTSKAEEVFKKIFKFGGKDSLLGHTESAMENLEETLKTGYGMVVGSKQAKEILSNTPYAKALKGIGKMAVAGAVVGTAKVGSKISELTGGEEGREDRSYQRKWDKEYAKIEAEHSSYANRSDRDAEIEEMQREATRRLMQKGIIDPKITREANDRFLETPRADYQAKLDESSIELEKARKELENSPNDSQVRNTYNEAEQRHAAAQADIDKYNELTEIKTSDIIKGRAEKIFDIENAFRFTKVAGKTDFKVNTQNLNAISDAIFGTAYFDPKKMKYVRAKDGIYTRFSAENMLGLSKDDKKILKEQILLPMGKSIGGMISLFGGMGMAVMDPKVGLPLLAVGIPATHRTFHRTKDNDKYKNRKYKYVRPSVGAINTMTKGATEEISKASRRTIGERLKARRKGFVEKFKNGDVKAVTLGVAFGATLGPVALATHTALHPVKTAKGIKNSTMQVVNWMKSDKEHKIQSVKNAGVAATNFSKNIARSTASTAKSTGKFVIDSEYRREKLGDAKESVVEFSKDVSYTASEYSSRARNAGTYVGGRFYRKLGISENIDNVEKHILNQRRKLEQGIREDAIRIMGIQSRAEMAQLMATEFQKLEDSTKAQDIKAAEKLGYVFNPKTRMITRKERVEASDIKPINTSNVKLNYKDVDQILDKILPKFSHRDVRASKTQSDIMVAFTKELKEKKYDGKVEDLFTDGKDGFTKIVKGKIGKIKEVQQLEEELKSILGEDDFKVVQGVIEKSDKKQDSTSMLEQISLAIAAATAASENSGNGGDDAKVVPNKSVPVEEVIEATDIKEPEKNHSKPSHKEVDKVLEEALKICGITDVKSESAKSTIIDKFTSLLREGGYIKGDEKAEDIFKGGRTTLSEKINKKADRMKYAEESANSSSGTSNENIPGKSSVATPRSSGQVDSSKDGSRSVSKTPSDAKASGAVDSSKDGSMTAGVSDRGSVVDSRKTGDSVVVFSDGSEESKAKNNAISKYVTAITSGPKVEKMKSKGSRKKVAEALNMMLPENDATYGTESMPEEQDLSLEKMLEQVKTSKKVTKGGREVSLNAAEADTATKMLEKLLEIKAVNEIAIKDVSMKSGTKEYVKQRQKKSTLAIEINQLEKQHLQYQQQSANGTQDLQQLDNAGGVQQNGYSDLQGQPKANNDGGQRFDENSAKSGTNNRNGQGYTGSQGRAGANNGNGQGYNGTVKNPNQNANSENPYRNQDAKTIYNRIQQKNSEIRRVDQRMKMAGPAVDINSIIKDINKAADGSRKVGKK